MQSAVCVRIYFRCWSAVRRKNLAHQDSVSSASSAFLGSTGRKSFSFTSSAGASSPVTCAQPSKCQHTSHTPTVAQVLAATLSADPI